MVGRLDRRSVMFVWHAVHHQTLFLRLVVHEYVFFADELMDEGCCKNHVHLSQT